jgi:hypothetical protein
LAALVIATSLLAMFAAPASAGGWRGYFGTDLRGFGEEPVFQGQQDGGEVSVVLEPEYARTWREGRDSFVFHPFARYDSRDEQRTHFDLRELYWRRASGSWDLLVGVGQVFWGVTESQHLVDIVNQTDLVENPNGEIKLGQPMVKFSLVRNWGIVDLFVLPGFRERTFPGTEGRLRPPVPVRTDEALYESSAGARHVDFAVRWSHAIGAFDIGVSHFSGTSRDPRFVPRVGEDGQPETVPFYELIDQSGVDLQATNGSFLWKLEAIRRSGLETHVAATGGLEYTFWGVFGSSLDVGVLGEYLWDERGGFATPFADDLFVGTRLALNDVQDTAILAGAILDREGGGRVTLIEAERRIGARWVIGVELRSFSGMATTDPFGWLRADDYFQTSIKRFF